MSAKKGSGEGEPANLTARYQQMQADIASGEYNLVRPATDHTVGMGDEVGRRRQRNANRRKADRNARIQRQVSSVAKPVGVGLLALIGSEVAIRVYSLFENTGSKNRRRR